MERFEVATAIARPAPEVFDALRRLDQLPVWTPGVLEIRRIGGDTGPAEVGTSAVLVGRLLGRTFESGLRYSEIVPDELVVLVTTSGPFELEVRASIEACERGSTLRARCSGEGRGALRLAGPMLARLTRSHFATALERLKALLESQARTTDESGRGGPS